MTKKLNKDAKFSVHIILLKELARKIRSDHPELRIEAHPDTNTRAILFIGRRDKNTSLRFNFRRRVQSSDVTGPDAFEYKLVCDLVLDGHRNKKFRMNWANPHNSISVNLQEPDSIDRIEQWIYGLMDYLYADTQDEKECAADND